MDCPSTVEGPAMKSWILSVQKWIGDNDQGFSVERKLSDDSVIVESSVDYDNDQSLYAHSLSFHFNVVCSHHFSSDDFASSLQETDDSISQHIRSFSVESDISIYSDMANLHAPSKRNASHSPSPSRLRLDVPVVTRSASANTSPIRTLASSSLPTPDESVPSTDEESSSRARVRRGKLSWHLRGASAFASASYDTAKRIGAKSLP